jgi:hypothetical protein
VGDFPLLGGIAPLKDFWEDSLCWFCLVRRLKFVLLWPAIAFVFWGAVDFAKGI